jgi:hypothetical protein
VVTIIDIDLIKIIETRLYASIDDPRASFGPGVSSSLQPGQRTVPFPIERRGTVLFGRAAVIAPRMRLARKPAEPPEQVHRLAGGG